MARVLIVLIALLQAPVSSRAGQTADRSSSSSDYRISMDVDLVALDVSVMDRRGRYVSGLQKPHFQVLESGRPQEIKLFRSEDAPVTAGLIVDGSSSMREKRAETAKAALAFVKHSNEADEVFVVNFNENVHVSLPLPSSVTADPEVIRQALYARPAGGQTALYDAIIAGLEQFPKGRHQRKALLVFSDGGDNASAHELDEVVRRLEESDVTVYTLGLFDPRDPDRNPKVLRKLARTTGGRVFLPGRLERVAEVCRDIAKEIRARYTIGYAPSEPGPEGSFRSVEVKVNAPRGRFLVRTRAGYRVPARPMSEVTP